MVRWHAGLLSYGVHLCTRTACAMQRNVEPTTLDQKATWAPLMLGVTAVQAVGSHLLVEKPLTGSRTNSPAVDA